MAIVFPCPCGRELAAPDLAARLRAICPRCGATVRVPATADSRPDPTDTNSWRMLVSRAKSQISRGSRPT